MAVNPPRTDPRQRLLELSIEYVATHGLGDLTLRGLATAIGTSHRMLIHHFGSKEGLWVAIVREVEARQLGLLGDVLPDPGQPIGEAMWAWWKHISDPSLWPNERLFFEIYGQALQGRRHTTALLDGIVESWVEPAAQHSVSRGIPPEVARAHARLAGVATTRGLLLLDSRPGNARRGRGRRRNAGVHRALRGLARGIRLG